MQRKKSAVAVSDCQSGICGFRALYVLVSSLTLVVISGFTLAMMV